VTPPAEESRPTPRQLVARLLRQRQELGADPLVLEHVKGTEALALARRGPRESPPILQRSRTPSPAPPTASPPSTSRSTPSVITQRSASAEGSVITQGEDPGKGREVREGVADPGVDGALPTDYGELRELCLTCTRCRLAEGRTQVVFSDGNPAARVMVVGEAPGANEDATGLPFVGAAGKFLDLLLASVGLSRADSVYICNVIKCRPPGNRNPRPDEIEACSPYLRAQIRTVQPEAILAVGTFAGQLLTGENAPLGKLRGRVHAYQGTPLVVTYHPAALLRNSGWTRPTWNDLQLLRQIMDEL
jgi:uracil-DNA glycosylase